jgi:carboxypeptidase family protein
MKRYFQKRKASLITTAKQGFSALIMMLLLMGSIPAQTGTSSITGQVLDPQGQAVPGATVTLTSVETNAVRTQKSSDKGVFVFELIPPGSYRLETEAAGFKKAIVNDVRALVSKPTEVPVQLEVGSISEAVTVSAGSAEALINTQDATIGNNFVEKQIVQLPLESRNVVELLSLQPGVTKEGYVNGSRSDQANITLDGIDVNEQQTGLDIIADFVNAQDQAFSSVLRVTPDSIQEFRVTTTNPNATQGRSSGAQVSLVTKSGTNEFHGGVYEFHRNTATTANDFFNNRTVDENGNGIPRPKLIRNVFGGTFGGPVKKDKLFFFYSYEGRRDESETSVVRTVPLTSLGRGEVRFHNTNGGITTLNVSALNQLFPDVGVNPLAIAVLADAARKYPANDPTIGDGLNVGGFRFNAPTPLRWNTNTVKFDYNLSSKHILSLRGNYQQDVIGRVPRFPDTAAPNFWSHPTGIAASHTWTVTNSLVNNFRYGLTREAFTSQGDSSENDIFFRFVFEPTNASRTLSRITPVHNFIDDVSWFKGAHSFQFGTNIRVIRNKRTSFAASFDQALTNPSFYESAGGVLLDPISGIADGDESPVQNAVAAVIGRFSQYTANFNFDRDGSILGVGQGVGRTFATEEYDFYFQDSWKFSSSLTFTFGLRYGLSRPVYEANGLQVKPTVSLGNYFEQRKAGAAQGHPFNDPITVDLAGPANGRPGFYDWDKNNLQPRVAIAWSPNFKGGLLRRMFGGEGDSVFRGGFAMTNDHIGQQLAVQFDLNNTLGFSSAQTVAAETFNVTDNPAPLFTGLGQNVRSLPLIQVPAKLVFPLQTPADGDARIESSLDDTLVTPVNYSWNVTYERKLRGGLLVQAAYIGRLGRNLLATRDIMALNNLVDPKSGQDWYTAANLLANFREKSTPINQIPNIAYFDNLFPAFRSTVNGVLLTPTQSAYRRIARGEVGGRDNDWTTLQLILDDISIFGENAFYQPQYAALSTFSTVANSDYHAGTLSIRERFKEQLTLDFNYTFSKSIDDASGLQNSGAYGSAFILNPLRPQDNRALSDFDVRHIINLNSLWQLPVGKGRPFLGDMPGFAEAIIGGWQLTNIFRWNSGLPIQTPFDAAQWATNWNVQSNGIRTVPIETSPTKSTVNLFEDPVAAYRSFRNARPGETGDRNVLRNPGYVSLDLGLDKTFTMPWSESHKLQFRWEVFNVTNTQRLGVLFGGRSGLGLDIDPALGSPPPNFGTYIGIQGAPRVMQFGLKYQF